MIEYHLAYPVSSMHYSGFYLKLFIFSEEIIPDYI